VNRFKALHGVVPADITTNKEQPLDFRISAGFDKATRKYAVK
jgi:hypothetical protein